MESQVVVAALGALAHESRLTVFRSLVKRGPQGYTPTALLEQIDIPAPTLSFHLKELQRAGLLTSRREGRFLYYSANFETMQGLIDFLTDQCCSLSDEACDTSCRPVAATAKSKRA